MAVRQRLAGHEGFRDDPAAAMAAAAHLDFLAQSFGPRAARGPGRLGIARPGDAGALVEAREQALGVVVRSKQQPALCPSDMRGALAVTRLAADADLLPGGVEAIGLRIVILGDAGGVTLGAHEVPVLVQLGPMERIVMADMLIGVEMEPALAALRLRAAVPGNGERLHAPIRKLDEILLQGLDPERVFHLEFVERAVRPVGLDVELAVLFEEA